MAAADFFHLSTPELARAASPPLALQSEAAPPSPSDEAAARVWGSATPDSDAHTRQSRSAALSDIKFAYVSPSASPASHASPAHSPPTVAIAELPAASPQVQVSDADSVCSAATGGQVPAAHVHRRFRSTDLPSIDSLNALTSEQPDMLKMVPGLDEDMQASLCHWNFDQWSEIETRTRIPYASSAFAALVAIVISRVDKRQSMIAAIAASRTAHEVASTAPLLQALQAAQHAALTVADAAADPEPIAAAHEADAHPAAAHANAPAMQHAAAALPTLPATAPDAAAANAAPASHATAEVADAFPGEASPVPSVSSTESGDNSPKDGVVYCPRVGCSTSFSGPQAKLNLCRHLDRVCLQRDKPLAYSEMAKVRKMELAQCKVCTKFMSARNYRERHSKVCKQLDTDAAEQIVHGRYGKYGSECPYFIKERRQRRWMPHMHPRWSQRSSVDSPLPVYVARRYAWLYMLTHVSICLYARTCTANRHLQRNCVCACVGSIY
jgi:hypothetical protein